MVSSGQLKTKTFVVKRTNGGEGEGVRGRGVEGREEKGVKGLSEERGRGGWNLHCTVLKKFSMICLHTLKFVATLAFVLQPCLFVYSLVLQLSILVGVLDLSHISVTILFS